ncbi:hypothetical protein JTB14_013035 [Gonioctena quinquepunctata]|nr:hypothetical protein JTB14_013035 [Gonioctena quinquepunctata]
MFLSGSKGTANTVKRLHHDVLLNFSEKSLFEGTDRTCSQVYVEHPYPIQKPFETSDDVVKDILKGKEEYSKLLEIKKKRYKFDEKDIEKKKFTGTEYIYLPKHLLEFYQKKDPDPRFNCDYNYYYTGGVLEHIEFDNIDYLIRCDVHNNLCMTNVINNDEIIKLDFSGETTIYSLKALKTEEGLFLVVREKQKVSILKFLNVTSVNSIWTKDFKTPVFDAKLNKVNAAHLGVVLFNKFVVENVEKNVTICQLKNDFGTDSDNFQQFQFISGNLVLLMDRYKVKIYDYLARTEETSFDPKLIDCNSLCTFSILENSLLLVTRHYLMKSDLRCLTEASYYSHSLGEAPCYMDYTSEGEDTYLCLSGQSVHSKVLFTGNSPYSLPFEVPSILDTLKECRLANPDLVLEKYLDNRLNYSTTGLKVLNLEGEISIFSTNCLGEIFKQTVSDSEPGKHRPVGVLLDWVNTIEKPTPVLHVSLVEEMGKARFALNSNPQELYLKKFRKESKATEFLSKFGPRFKKKNVKGTLALDFLEVWEDDDEKDDEEMDNLPEVPVHDKVHSWIQTHDFSDDDNDVNLLNISRDSQRK